ncbi:MAG: hypothetical protein WBF58_16795 [Xanthobacteraceae bacterium]
MTDDSDQPEHPRVEPEIIPPDRSPDRSDERRTPWRGGPFGGTRATDRVYVARIGPFGAALLLLAIAVIIAIVIFVFLGALLIWIPIIVVLLAGVALARAVRRFGNR